MYPLSIEKILPFISYWPPFLSSGIRVLSYNLEKGFIFVGLRSRVFNKNALGTHFGGSLFSMSDPWYVFILMHHLSKDYVIWDKSANILFEKATTEPVYAKFHISPKYILEVKNKTSAGHPCHFTFKAEIRTYENQLISKIEKTVYVRKRLPK